MEKAYTDLKPEDVNYVLVKTTGAGPFAEDGFFLILGKEGYWEIPQSDSTGFLEWLERFPDVDFSRFIESMGSTEERCFILYRGAQYPILSEKNREALKSRLMAFLQANFEGDRETLYAITVRVLERYSDPSRHYHDLRHVQHCLWELDQIPASQWVSSLGEPIDRSAIELAIWYHDLVYSVSSTNNESASAEQMKTDLGRFPTRLDLELVSRMIRCTAETLEQRHLSESEEYFLDIDFSVLGQRAIEYEVYRQAIRLEYRQVPAPIYYWKRKSFLRSVLGRRIYQTDWFRNRYEAQAVANIQEELSQWQFRFLPEIRGFRSNHKLCSTTKKIG